MSVLWVIERTDHPRPVAGSLCGDFAVRVIATVASFRTLSRLSRGPQPDLVVAHAEAAAELAAAMGAAATRVLLLAAGPEGAPEPLPAGMRVAVRPACPLELSRLVRDHARSDGGRSGGILRYRELMLDIATLELRAGASTGALPLKEAQLLKLFLEQPGACLARDAIAATVWRGVRVTPRTIDSHVSRLRKHLDGTGVEIKSVYGGGYVLR